jgi:hypothetical protein
VPIEKRKERKGKKEKKRSVPWITCSGTQTTTNSAVCKAAKDKE